MRLQRLNYTAMIFYRVIFVLCIMVLAVSCTDSKNPEREEESKVHNFYSCKLKPELIHSWENYEKLPSRETPYHEIYTACGKTLIYVAAQHGNNPESNTFKLINRLFENHPIEYAIVEGFPSEIGISPQSMINYANNAETTPGDAEPYLTIRQAITKGAKFQGGEPSDKQVMDEVAKADISPIDLLGFYIVRQIPQLIRREQINDANDPRLTDEIFSMVGSFSDATGVPIKNLEAVDGLANFRNWYEAINGVSFTENYRNTDSWPGVTSSSGPRATNTISTKVADARDHHIIGVIDAALRESNTIIVVYGASHHTIQEPALKAAFEP